MRYVLFICFSLGLFTNQKGGVNINTSVVEYQHKLIRSTELQWSDTRLPDKYLESNLKTAILLEKKYRVPVEVQMAVDIIESGLNKKPVFNNHSSITCKCNYNKELRSKHKLKDVCFLIYDSIVRKHYYLKKYKNIQENWQDKARIIAGYSWFKPNQSFAFYAKHLQGTYAVSKTYTKGLTGVYNSYLKDIEYVLLYH